jgi:hypothetical protein
MIPFRCIAMATLLVTCSLSAIQPAGASCLVVGDSVGVGIGRALGSCVVSARVGLSSAAAARRVPRGKGWVIASIGSNDFPSRISPAQRAASQAHVLAALSHMAAVAGDRLILIIPANGARAVVAGWTAAHGARTLTFAPGPDGIHPRDYVSLARRIRAMMGAEGALAPSQPADDPLAAQAE